MNVRPGDLAVIVRSDSFPEEIGKFVNVIRLAPIDDEAEWECLPTSPMKAQVIDGPRAGEVIVSSKEPVDIPDSWLRPIRPQPDDAIDETLLWTFSTTKVYA